MNSLKLFVLLLATGMILCACQSGNAQGMKKHLTPGMVNMVDLGADRCMPCKMMAPIIEELKKEYQGKAAIVFLDVWQNQAHAKAFGIRVIPTQVFFDRNGREVMRHEGFMDKQSIKAQLARMGVNL